MIVIVLATVTPTVDATRWVQVSDADTTTTATSTSALLNETDIVHAFNAVCEMLQALKQQQVTMAAEMGELVSMFEPMLVCPSGWGAFDPSGVWYPWQMSTTTDSNEWNMAYTTEQSGVSLPGGTPEGVPGASESPFWTPSRVLDSDAATFVKGASTHVMRCYRPHDWIQYAFEGKVHANARSRPEAADHHDVRPYNAQAFRTAASGDEALELYMTGWP